MYDRAPRDFVKLNGSTAHNVGPGSYDADVPPKARFKAGRISENNKVFISRGCTVGTMVLYSMWSSILYVIYTF